MDVAEVGDVGHLLQQGQVQQPGLDERPRAADVDGLAPLARSRVEHVDVRLAVDQEEAVLGGGDGEGLGRVHDLNLARLPTLEARRILFKHPVIWW